jgi:glycosyltransferase involved in cell wall biosynthesis
VRLSVLVIDADADTPRAAAREPFDVLTPADVGLDRTEFHRMAAIYDLLELATAIKPWLLRHLVGADSTVVYLDPDIEVFSPIDEVWELAAEHGIVVTPHSTTPLPRDGSGPNEELLILGSGAYNLGFIAVGPQGRTFLDWWADRLRREGLIDKEAAMFVDQRWVDLVPSYFDVHILRGPGWNVAYWNLSVRTLTRSETGFEVDGEPLRFFHYSGFDPDHPDLLSCYEEETKRTPVSDHPVLAQLCSRYADQLTRNGHRAHSRITHGFAETAAGLLLDRYARRLYRRELLAAENGGGRFPPDPFDARGARAFEDWLRAPAAAHRVTRYLRALWHERADLRASFPDLQGPEARFYVDWARALGRFEPNVAPELVALETHRRRDPTPPGANVAGYVRAESGVGAVSRAVVAALDAAGAPSAIVPFTKTPSRQESYSLDDRLQAPDYRTNIVCVNADALPGFAEEAGEAFFSDRRTIAVWQWEVEVFPEWMAASAQRVDEIWMSSEHAAQAVRERTSTPVLVFPLPVPRPVPSRPSRTALGLPDGFVFLFCFDFDSVFERKNPLAAIEAFARAFAPGSGPHLVIKSVRGEAHPDELDRLRAAAAARPDVHVNDGYLPPGEQAALMAACDAYVSLHRAEGFGLTMAEAMALGKPVVATGYSGNLEFMDVTNSWLVPYELVTIPEGCDPYPAGARWASPDLDAAAEMMRRVVEDPAEAHERGARAAADMARLHSPHAGASFVLERLRYVPEPPELERLRLKPQLPWTPVKSADTALATGPDVESPTSYGFVTRVVRKLVYRVARHYIEHAEKVQSGLLDGVRDLDERLRTEVDASRNLEARVHELSERLTYESKHRESLEARLVPALDPDVVSEYPAGRVQRMRSYAGLFGTQAPVLAVGHEATALIDLLSHQGINGFALDAGAGSFEIAHALDEMEGLADRSLGGIFTVRVIDHLSVEELQRFLALSRRKLDAGGVLVAETEDPRDAESIEHHGAIAPRALLELCRSTGFEQAYVLFPNGASSADEDEIDQGEFAIVASVLLPSHR